MNIGEPAIGSSSKIIHIEVFSQNGIEESVLCISIKMSECLKLIFNEIGRSEKNGLNFDG
jgi:shikimate 5-dehydrogenase